MKDKQEEISQCCGAEMLSNGFYMTMSCKKCGIHDINAIDYPEDFRSYNNCSICTPPNIRTIYGDKLKDCEVHNQKEISECCGVDKSDFFDNTGASYFACYKCGKPFKPKTEEVKKGCEKCSGCVWNFCECDCHDSTPPQLIEGEIIGNILDKVHPDNQEEVSNSIQALLSSKVKEIRNQIPKEYQGLGDTDKEYVQGFNQCRLEILDLPALNTKEDE